MLNSEHNALHKPGKFILWFYGEISVLPVTEASFGTIGEFHILRKPLNNKVEEELKCIQNLLITKLNRCAFIFNSRDYSPNGVQFNFLDKHYNNTEDNTIGNCFPDSETKHSKLMSVAD